MTFVRITFSKGAHYSETVEGIVVMVTRMVRFLGADLMGIIEVTFLKLLERGSFEG